MFILIIEDRGIEAHGCGSLNRAGLSGAEDPTYFPMAHAERVSLLAFGASPGKCQLIIGFFRRAGRLTIERDVGERIRIEPPFVSTSSV